MAGGLPNRTHLVSRVTRKKLSSGASIQLGRLLRTVTPPLLLPLPPLLRPLCCCGMRSHTVYITRRSKQLMA